METKMDKVLELLEMFSVDVQDLKIYKKRALNK